MAAETKRKTTFISEGPDWVEIDSDNNEIARIRKPTFETGHVIKPFAIYGGYILREIGGHAEGTQVGIMTVPGGKLYILKNGEQIHLDAKIGEDFDFDIPINVIEDAPDRDDDDLQIDDRERVADMLKQVEEVEAAMEEHAIVGADLIAEMIAAEQVNMKPENARVEIFHGNGTHSDDGCLIIYDDSKVLKYEKVNIKKMVESGQMPGFIVKPDQAVQLLFLALQAREALMMPKASMQLRLGVAHYLFNILEEIGII